MTWSANEETRVLAIESLLNSLQEAVNRLPTKRQLNALIALLQGNLNTLTSEVEQIDITGNGNALDTHKSATDAHIAQLDDRYYTQTELDNGQLDSLYISPDELDLVSGHLQDRIDEKAELIHTHDDRYYTETELNTGQLDNRYYTETEMDVLLADESDSGHTHWHNTLSGLSNNDHTQYFNAATEPLVASGQNLTLDWSSMELNNFQEVALSNPIANDLLYFDGTHWIDGSYSHNNLVDFQGGTTGEYYHLTTAQVGNLHANTLDHAAVTASSPINLAGQALSFGYNTDDFTVSGNDLRIREPGIDHGSVGGLLDDDHPQYVLANGNRTMTNLTVTNDATINGVSIATTLNGIEAALLIINGE